MTKKIPVPRIKDTEKDREKPDKLSKAREELRDFFDESYIDPKMKVTNKEFLDMFKQCGGNAAQACRNLGVSYMVYMDKQRKYPDIFKEARESLKEKEKEFIYSKLLELVAAGNVPATIFACKAILGLKETQVQEISAPTLDVEAAIRELKDRMED